MRKSSIPIPKAPRILDWVKNYFDSQPERYKTKQIFKKAPKQSDFKIIEDLFTKHKELPSIEEFDKQYVDLGEETRCHLLATLFRHYFRHSKTTCTGSLLQFFLPTYP